MTIAISLEHYLSDKHVAFDCLEHVPTQTARESAKVSKVPDECLAKAIVLRTRDGYCLAVVPASHRMKLETAGRCIGYPVALALEDEFTALFPDCEPGAVPPIGAAYGFRTVVDKRLETLPDIYFEAGDHRTLVHMSGRQFRYLMESEPHGDLCAGFDDETPFAYFGA